MCAVRGTKLYGLRIKKDFQIRNNDHTNIFKAINLKFKKVWIKFEQSLNKKLRFILIPFIARRVYFSLASS